MIHTEAAFGTVCQATLMEGGYVGVDKALFDPERAILPAEVIGFIKATQSKEWAKIEAVLGDKTEAQVLRDLVAWMDSNGSLATLRHGFKCYGRTLRVAYFRAAHGLNPELEERYQANRVGITRQLAIGSAT
jgi:type I restriction enzyme, R subunit